MLSIGEFSEMSQLPAQTLRFYHSEGLLVPTSVDERTGYRYYAFEQVEQALLIATLRRAGLGVRQVRRALDDASATPDLLDGHRAALREQRSQEDDALADAQAITTEWPQVRRCHVPETAVLSTVVPGGFDDDAAIARVLAATQRLAAAAESCGARVIGAPWKAHALDTAEQKQKLWTAEGPDWEVSVPVTAAGAAHDGAAPPAAAPSDGVAIGRLPARDEVSVLVPGRESLAKHAAALHRLLTHALEQECVIDLGRPRHLLHDDGIEIATTIWAAGDEPAPS